MPGLGVGTQEHEKVGEAMTGDTIVGAWDAILGFPVLDEGEASTAEDLEGNEVWGGSKPGGKNYQVCWIVLFGGVDTCRGDRDDGGRGEG